MHLPRVQARAKSFFFLTGCPVYCSTTRRSENRPCPTTFDCGKLTIKLQYFLLLHMTVIGNVSTGFSEQNLWLGFPRAFSNCNLYPDICMPRSGWVTINRKTLLLVSQASAIIISHVGLSKCTSNRWYFRPLV